MIVRACCGTSVVSLLVAVGAARAQRPARAATPNAALFTVTDTSVRQGQFEAIARSRDTIVSTYPRAAREVRFRFSINGLENEFPPGTEHTIYLRPIHGRLVTRAYGFGDEREPPPPTPEASASSEDGVGQVMFRVDLRDVLRSIRTRGYYDPPLGGRITQVSHVYVVGEPEPLTWDYSALRPGTPVELTDPDGDGIYEGTVPVATQYTRPLGTDGKATWARTVDLRQFPDLTSAQRLQDALYRMSLEELTQLVRPDSALSAGAKWPGVWTRDVSLSTILSLAIIAPDAAKRSLLAKVDSLGRIIQDTGTGGSWPVSSDRMLWALAAWEICTVTGDRQWLRQAYDITRRSAEADLHAVRDRETGLFNGESSFLDWREQSYPRWMQPADIYRSQNLGTNVVHYAAYRVLGEMARSLGEPSAHWDSVAVGIRDGLTRYLWQAEYGWFAQYRYGRVYLTRSPRAEGLGESLASIYGAVTEAQRAELVRRSPVVAFGAPTFWPYIAGERFYHNATIWPFVNAYWTWAAAEAGNATAVERGLDDATRFAALFLTNKENTYAPTGHFEGTALNSDRQLWSVAGTLAETYRVLFGMRFARDQLSFHPMVPHAYAGDRTLRDVHYRGATLTITVHGYGNAVASARLDGRSSAQAVIPATLTGAHTVEITMNHRWPASTVHLVPNRFAPLTPDAALHGNVLTWAAIPSAVRYVVYENGMPLSRTTDTTLSMRQSAGFAEYQVLAVDAAGDESFLSRPIRVVPSGVEQIVKPAAEPLQRTNSGFTGAGYVRLTREENTRVSATLNVARDGAYVLDARYANGNGPVNTEDKVGVRTVLVDGDTAGVLVFPQRGKNQWSDWDWSNPLRVDLRQGTHTIVLAFTPLDENMNRHENTALLDVIRLTRLTSKSDGGRR